MMEPNNPVNNPAFRAVYLSNITVIQNIAHFDLAVDLAVDLAMDMNLALNPPRWCQRCGVFETPLWRTGPLGPKTLCNACGLRYKKENKQVDTTLSLGSLNSKMPGNYYTKST